MPDPGAGPATIGARRRWTLRFLDPLVERAYRTASTEPARRRLRLAAVFNIPTWIAGAVLAPLLIPGLDPRPIWITAAFVSVVLTSAAVWSLGPRSHEAVGTVFLAVNLVAGVGVVTMTVVTGLYVEYAALLLLFTAVNGLAVQRMPFLLAVLAVVWHSLAFSVGGLVAGAPIGLQLFVLGSAFAVLSSGSYMVEDAERRLFAQALEIGNLHRTVDELLHQYLSPDVADSLIAEPGRAELGGEQVEVTVLFADLTGFTTFSERVEPAAAVAMLNDAFGAAVPVIRAAEGTIVQFAGDAIMVIWNAPRRQPDHARRAAEAALALQAGTAGLSADASLPRFRVGLNTGPALVGNIGGADMRSFTAIGDTINLAARLQAFAPAGSVVLGPRTHQLLRDVADVVDLGEQPLKGKAAPVRIVELRGLRPSRSPS